MEELNVLSIVLAVVGIVSAVWKKFDADFWKKMAVEAFEAIDTVKKAKEESSPGGKELTLEEKAAIGEQAMDVIVPLWDKLDGKLKKKA